MKWLFLAAMVLVSPVQAAEKVLMLSDQEVVALKTLLDVACKAQGLTQMCRNAFILSDKIDSAGVVTEQKPVPAVEPKKEGEQ